MRVIFTGGGTGGHIYPIMAIIERLKERGISTNDEILFVGTQKGLESRIVPAAGVNFKTIKIQGFNRKHPLKNFETIKLFLQATKSARKILQEFKPDVVLGTGGYVSGAMVYEAAKMHIPTMIHESNSVVGLANKFLGHYVDKICYTFDDAAKEFSEKKKLVKTGNPRSQQVLGLHEEKIDLKKEWGLNPQMPTVLVFGGSRGALAINRIMLKSLVTLKKKPYQIIWATGTITWTVTTPTGFETYVNITKEGTWTIDNLYADKAFTLDKDTLGLSYKAEPTNYTQWSAMNTALDEKEITVNFAVKYNYN